MHDVNVYRVSAFTKDSRGGNEAGVVVLNKWLSDKDMQEVAGEVAYSETVFAKPSKNGIHTRFFTPLKEVTMCGHASLALFTVLYNEGFIEVGSHMLYAGKSTLKATVGVDSVTLFFNKPKTVKVFSGFDQLKRLNLNEHDLNSVPPAIMDAGVKELYIGLKDIAKLKAYQPVLPSIKALSTALGVAGIYLYTLDIETQTIQGRNFLPAIGINEESATGTASASLSTHLYVVLDNPPSALTFYQGQWMEKPSQLNVMYALSDHILEGIYVMGRALIKDTIRVTIGHS